MMAAIELMARYSKNPKSEIFQRIESTLDTQELIKGDKFDRDIERAKMLEGRTDVFEYGPMVVNLRDICGFNEVDPLHTLVSFYGGKNFIFKIGHELLKGVYQTLLGVVIHDFTNPEAKTKGLLDG